ncbi:DUF3592 domain-containing protein [Natronosporangium hydrolyticum]|uniref:DUF3592 domain-containing protein n=1 Tax=Natronosporangium hydrolyticum TaxID=2811111 RepID=A0A895YEC9_9ACTN|nr:DUF3592 domain-containing protein [Natronosporangium hydrolyticum]
MVGWFWKHVALPLLVGAALIGAGVATHLVMVNRVGDRQTMGVALAAEVVEVNSKRGFKSVTISYTYSGVAREVTLRKLFGDVSVYDLGDRVTAYIEPADPDKVALAEGFASEGWRTQLPLPLALVGVVLLIRSALRPFRHKPPFTQDIR